MAAKVVAFLCEKGGPGKSTGTTNFASYLSRKLGKRVLIVDHDPQATTSKWSYFLEPGEGWGDVAVVVMKKIQRDLPNIAHGFDYVIIDGQPITDAVTVDAIKVADLVIIPIRPSGPDVWAGVNTAEILKQRQAINDGKPIGRILISQAIVGSVIARDIHENLASYQIPMMKERTHIRVAYTEAISIGKSAMDLPESHPARIEIEKISVEILEMLG